MSLLALRLLFASADAASAESILALPLPVQFVTHVTSVSAARSAAATTAFDAVLLDIGMPDGSAADLVIGLREAAHGIPIVVLTDDESVALSCLAAGAEDCLEKQTIGASQLRRSLTYAIARTNQAPERRHLATKIREAERIQIARRVHDELGQLLTGIKLDLAWVAKRIDAATTEEIVARLGVVTSTIDMTIEAVQRIATELRPAALDAFGLREAIVEETRRFEGRTGVATEVVVHSVVDPDAATASVLFFTLQELLTNVARHARARKVCVELDDRGRAWLLRVEDDGIGIEDVAPISGSHGIVGMRERAESLGGTFALERGPRGGTLATVRVPSR